MECEEDREISDYLQAAQEFKFKGIPFFEIFTNYSYLTRVSNFNFSNKDIVVATYPRSGTTVTQEIVWQIKNKDLIEKGKRYGPISDRFPFIETNITKENNSGSTQPLENVDVLEKQTGTRFIKTHCARNMFMNQEGTNTLYDPKKGEENPKIIVTIRNPRDCAVSYYHFCKDNPYLGPYGGTWNNFFKMFTCGSIAFGSWLDFNLEWWRLFMAPEHPNLLLIKYEDLIKNKKGIIRKVAAFLDEKINDEQVEIIDHNTKFLAMQKEGPDNIMGDSASIFFRKGEVGDWEKYFSAEQIYCIENGFEKLAREEGLDHELI